MVEGRPDSRFFARAGRGTGLGLGLTAGLAAGLTLSAACNLRYDVIDPGQGAGGMTGGVGSKAGQSGAASPGEAGAAGIVASAGFAGGFPAGGGAVGGMVSGAGGMVANNDLSSICILGGRCEELRIGNSDQLDVLFIVDNSGSMREEQALLRDQFPRFIEALTTGDRDGDGDEDFAPAQSVGFAVASSDLGVAGISGIQDCEGLGDNGTLQAVSSEEITGCSMPAYLPRFLSYPEGIGEPEQLATDLSCIATLGTHGCGFEQQLESGLKALWPMDDTRVQFLSDPNGFGATGQSGLSGINGNFLRPDAVLAIVLLTDEDDCSSMDTSHLRPDDGTLPVDDPLRQQGLSTRCHHEELRAEPNNIYDVERYINAFKALHEGREDDVVFAAITGVPPELADAEPELGNVDGYYDTILSDAAMQEIIDDQGTTEVVDDSLMPVCSTENGKAYPARRITEVVRGFGDNGVLGSICAADFALPLQRLTDKISNRLGASCLPGTLARNQETGAIDCDVVWQLPLPGTAPEATPTDCTAPGFEFLSYAPRMSPSGRTMCNVLQLSVGEGSQNLGDGQGFYYDDFSDETMSQCPTSGARIAFTAGAKPPTGVNVFLDCVGVLVTE